MEEVNVVIFLGSLVKSVVRPLTNTRDPMKMRIFVLSSLTIFTVRGGGGEHFTLQQVSLCNNVTSSYKGSTYNISDTVNMPYFFTIAFTLCSSRLVLYCNLIKIRLPIIGQYVEQ